MGQTSRIPSLDGLRAISIILVLLGHLDGTAGYPFTNNPVMRLADLANVGVRVFFVISGFLITGLLLKEVEKTGRISLRHFYFRRTLRIFPPYYSLILVAVIMGAYGIAHLRPGDVTAALTYTMNYHHDRGWTLGHTWSLSVEEQFYLLWPAIIGFAGVRRGLWAAAVFVLLAPLIRIAMLIPPGGAPGLMFTFQSVGDAIAAGCLLAGLRGWLWDRAIYRRLMESGAIALAPFIIVFLATFPVLSAKQFLGFDRLYLGVYNLAGITVINLLIAMCIDWAIRNVDRPVGRFLNWRPVAYIGTISYSLYLWQELFLNRGSTREWTRFPLNILLVAVVALASFYLIEKPSLRARQWIERRWRAA
jgi:peptidoglycan/LPS O-acetylase OafA/YrhL